MSDGKVILNKKGEYLVYGVCSSHGPGTCYSFSWTSILNDASIVRSSNELQKLSWKESNPINDAVSEISASATRIVTLLRE